MKKKTLKDVLVIGFALFAMFFGAGNLIFPGALGHAAGTKWPLALLATILVGIMLPILAVVAVTNMGKGFEAICRPVGKWYYNAIYLLSLLGIFVIATLPRTAATTHEISIAPLFPDIPIWLTVPIYFLIALFLALDKSSLVDRIGKFLTPGLLILLLMVIIKGLVTPLGEPIDTGRENVFGSAFLELYATGDLIAGHFFSAIIITDVLAKGYKEGREQKKVTLLAALVTSLLFIAVYSGLLIVAAGAGEVIPQGTERTALLAGMVRHLMGAFGSVSLAVAVALACMSTSVTLISISANYFNRLSKGKLSYRLCAVLVVIFASVFGSLGVEEIIKLAGPCFLAIYPSAIVLTFVGLFSRKLPNIGVYRYPVIFAFVYGIIDSLDALGLPLVGRLIAWLPYYDSGFAWILPAVAGGLIGYFICKDRPTKEPIIKSDNDTLEFSYVQK